jgi:hypothetical protein
MKKIIVAIACLIALSAHASSDEDARKIAIYYCEQNFPTQPNSGWATWIYLLKVREHNRYCENLYPPPAPVTNPNPGGSACHPSSRYC